MRHFIYASVGVSMLWGAFAGIVLAEHRTSDVATRLATQNQWLGSGSTAAGWKTHLKTAELEAQIARQDEADPATVATILAAYQANTPGLEKPQFVAVREALVAWHAELAQKAPVDLTKAATDAKATFVAPAADRAAKSKAKLQAALAKLNAFLARGGKERQQGWQNYLEWAKLETELAKPDAPDIKVLEAVSAKLFQNEPGLEMQDFLAARTALKAYIADAALAAEKDLPTTYGARLDDLSQRLAKYQQVASDEEAVAIGQTLGWLSEAQQASAVVQAVRQQYAQPNLHVFASQRLAAAGVKDKVDDVSPVRELILGTDVHGTARTIGNISLRTVPSAQRAVVEILMSGQSYSRNVGYNGPATIYSNGYTNLSAYKRVFVDEFGIQAQPAVAVASTKTTITGIGAKRKIVRKIAAKQVGSKTAQAEVIASQRAETRLERRIDNQAADMLGKAQDAYLNKFKYPLIRKGDYPQHLKMSTTSDGFRLVALHANAARLGAPTAPPDIQGAPDLSVRVHESLVGNAAETVLAGLTLTDEKLADMLKEATGEVPEELQISEDKDPWSITFSQVRPIAVVFDGNTATIAIHGQKFTRADQEIKNNMLISAKYKLEQVGNGSKLTRDGDVVVDYVDFKGGLSIKQVAFKTFLRKKFSSLFKPEIANDGLKLPGKWEKAGKLTLRQMEANKGWLTLGWEQPDIAERTASLK